MTRIVHPGQITCREIALRCTDTMEGAVQEEYGSRFEVHLAACDACREYVAQMRTTVLVLSRVRGRQLSDTELDRIKRILSGNE